MPVDPLWNSTTALELAAQRHPGALIRLGREHRSWTLAALGDRIGCSPATVSRLERRTRIVDWPWFTALHSKSASPDTS
ncbi:helix-turn-helix transcriptional regulator [Streptomyces sp. NPDC006140]|uniref:helix-turn-helix domain-containing protein n=1 Tax=Streptomyces sp. NPDC006140 TaxID=3154579 RepID=UPI0033D4A90F